MGALPELFRNAHQLVMLPLQHVAISEQVFVLLYKIEADGLRDRLLHKRGRTFIKFYIDNRLVFTTDVDLDAMTNPAWVFTKPKAFAAYPTSILRFSIYRYHRFQGTEEFIGDVQGLASSFSVEAVQHELHSEESPGAKLRVHMETSENIDKNNPKIDFVDPKDNAKRHIHAIMRQYSSCRKKIIRPTIVTIINGILVILEVLSHAVDQFVPGVPISDTVKMLLKPIHERVDALDKMHSSIQETMDILFHSFEQASRCPAHMRSRVIQLIEDCAQTVREWTEQEPLVQVFRAQGVKEDVETRLEQLSKVNEGFHPDIIVYSRPGSPDGCTCWG